MVLEEIKGSKLNPEQSSYLEGFFAGVRNRGFSFDGIDVAPTTGGASVDLDSLTAEERIKREHHPLDSYGLLLEDAARNKAPEKENVFRYKWHGLFFLSPNKEAFMCRLRIPGGLVNSHQLRELATDLHRADLRLRPGHDPRELPASPHRAEERPRASASHPVDRPAFTRSRWRQHPEHHRESHRRN